MGISFVVLKVLRRQGRGRLRHGLTYNTCNALITCIKHANYEKQRSC